MSISDPRIMKAHGKVATALLNGDLIKDNCQGCGSDKNIHAHHEDYDRPLDVIWLCVKCHGIRHQGPDQLWSGSLQDLAGYLAKTALDRKLNYTKAS